MKPVFIFLLRFVFLPFTGLFIDRIEGKENIPKGNNFIIAPNHLNGGDHFFTAYTFKKRLKDIRYVGAMDSLKIRLQSSLLYYFANTIIIFRKKESREQITTKIMKEVKNNKIVVIYPEGYTNSKEKLLKGKTGIVEIIKEKVPVLPVGIRNGKKGKIITIGKLMNFSKEIEKLTSFKKDNKDYYLTLREITDKIMCQLSVLSKKPYLYEKN